jgi:hypothetical protein
MGGTGEAKPARDAWASLHLLRFGSGGLHLYMTWIMVETWREAYDYGWNLMQAWESAGGDSDDQQVPRC